QAEDGIRDFHVTGVQTCALPISFARRRQLVYELLNEIPGVKTNLPEGAFYFFPEISSFFGKKDPEGNVIENSADLALYLLNYGQIGRASCRERVSTSVIAEEVH